MSVTDSEIDESISGREKMNDEFSLKTLEYIMQPKNFEEMEDHDGIAIVQGQCGDRMAFFLKVEDNVINKATFVTDGCGATVACGSASSHR